VLVFFVCYYKNFESQMLILNFIVMCVVYVCVCVCACAGVRVYVRVCVLASIGKKSLQHCDKSVKLLLLVYVS